MRRRHPITLLVTLASLLVGASGAQAALLNDGSTKAGVALAPGATLPTGVSAVSFSGTCTDPALSADLGGPQLPAGALCYHGGAVIHKNETFDLTWDAQQTYLSGTHSYVEQFLQDVASASGTLNSPYALTTQYSDASGAAQNASMYAGGCTDSGAKAGSTCDIGSPTGAGHDFPSSGCPTTGDSFGSMSAVVTNSTCLTDAQLQSELATMISQTGITGMTAFGYSPVVSLLLPPGVEVCLDSGGKLCSANGSLTPPPPAVSTSATGGTIPAGTYHVLVTYTTASGESAPSGSQTVTTTGATSTITIAAPPSVTGLTGWNAYISDANGTAYSLQVGTNPVGSPMTVTSIGTGGAKPPVATAFCSYHSYVNAGGMNVAYVVLPWVAGTSCDEPDATTIPGNATADQLSADVGQRLVSPLSQSHIAAIVDPGLDGWAAQDGAEIDDNGCKPLSGGQDSATLGSNGNGVYVLQREFNNGALLEQSPWTYSGCAPNVLLVPYFAVPSAVNAGDVVDFDASRTASTLIVPKAGYAWSFGDGASAAGPTVAHTYSTAGTYHATLTVTDRGGNVRTLSQSITVAAKSVPPTTPPPPIVVTTTPPTKTPTPKGTSRKFTARLTLIPQSLSSALRDGVAVTVSANETRGWHRDRVDLSPRRGACTHQPWPRLDRRDRSRRGVRGACREGDASSAPPRSDREAALAHAASDVDVATGACRRPRRAGRDRRLRALLGRRTCACGSPGGFGPRKG